jgi:hypothetical protein
VFDWSLCIGKVFVLRLYICADVRLRRMRHLLTKWLLLNLLIGWSFFLGRHLPGEPLMILLGSRGLGLLRVAILSKIHGVKDVW